ncbi:MAG: carboxylating nicotinate-nucleotide diphosphorylase, partial [Bacteroidales bacterium]|nr:carboxylating nicotinate-nucleotide diphosphorylase [Bacteroidales bacterium]
IATVTAEYVKQMEGLHTKVLDTRKTTPGLRLIEKEAVKIGGGTNHRIGLYDMIMLKDNHIDYAGGIEKAVAKAHKYLQDTGRNLKIEVETRNLDDVREVLRIGGVDRIMLDNFDIPTTREAVKIIGGKVETESSGGITISNIRQYAECGVDFVSIGALTHQIKSLDLSLKAVK